jgi:hypothetical protein
VHRHSPLVREHSVIRRGSRAREYVRAARAEAERVVKGRGVFVLQPSAELVVARSARAIRAHRVAEPRHARRATTGGAVLRDQDASAASTLSGSVRFVERAQAIAARYGERVIGWEEIGRADLRRATVVQHWYGNGAAAAWRRGAKVMLFPRLIGIAEIAWFPKSGRSWSEYRVRLGARADRLAALGIGFYRSPEVPWR